MRKAVFLILILTIFLPTVNLEAVDVYLNIARGQGKKIKISVPGFQDKTGRDTDNLTQKLAQIVQDDLRYSGFFYLVEPLEPILPEMPLEDKFERAKAAGAEIIADGKFIIEGGELILEGRLYDLSNSRQITGKSYRGEKKHLRQIAHRFSDEIVYRFTGKMGVAHTKIAFIHQEGRNKEIYLVDYDGYGLERLTYDYSLNLFPTWTPDGKELIYTTFKKGNPDLYVINFENKKAQELLSFQGLNIGAEVSPNGKEMVLVLSKDGNPEIYLYTFKKKSLKRLTYHRGVDSDPTWSPNGREIAFSSDRSGTPQIYIMDREGGNLRRLTFQGSYNVSPDWSPLGDQIAYAGMAKGVFDIYTINVHSGKVDKLTDGLFEGGNNETPCWSPDGRYLVYTSTRRGKGELFIMTGVGTEARQLTRTQSNCFSPAWSP